MKSTIPTPTEIQDATDSLIRALEFQCMAKRSDFEALAKAFHTSVPNLVLSMAVAGAQIVILNRDKSVPMFVDRSNDQVIGSAGWKKMHGIFESFLDTVECDYPSKERSSNETKPGYIHSGSIELSK